MVKCLHCPHSIELVLYDLCSACDYVHVCSDSEKYSQILISTYPCLAGVPHCIII